MGSAPGSNTTCSKTREKHPRVGLVVIAGTERFVPCSARTVGTTIRTTPGSVEQCGLSLQDGSPTAQGGGEEQDWLVLLRPRGLEQSLGETLDPEQRSLLARYFEEMKEIVQRHGGTVEKFIGDAVMAVFGVPTLHEDDALRARALGGRDARCPSRARASGKDRGIDGRGGDGHGGAPCHGRRGQRRLAPGARGAGRAGVDRRGDPGARSERGRGGAGRATRAEGQGGARPPRTGCCTPTPPRSAATTRSSAGSASSR